MCFKERDLLAGTMFEHETISTVIEQQCNRLVVIFSPSFLKSQANQFLVSYAQAVALGKLICTTKMQKVGDEEISE